MQDNGCKRYKTHAADLQHLHNVLPRLQTAHYILAMLAALARGAAGLQQAQQTTQGMQWLCCIACSASRLVNITKQPPERTLRALKTCIKHGRRCSICIIACNACRLPIVLWQHQCTIQRALRSAAKVFRAVQRLHHDTLRLHAVLYVSVAPTTAATGFSFAARVDVSLS